MEIITSYDLVNGDKMRLDKNAKSLTFFCRHSSSIITSSALERLKEISKENGNINARICLHSSPSELLHDMIILEYKDKKCRKPHKHIKNPETLHMIEGELETFMFSEDGNLLEKFILKENMIMRIPPGIYHLYLPVSDLALYKESKLGPFSPEDNILPNWDYTKALRNYIKLSELLCMNSSCKNPCSFAKK